MTCSTRPYRSAKITDQSQISKHVRPSMENRSKPDLDVDCRSRDVLLKALKSITELMLSDLCVCLGEE